ncbi:MAG: hypothetical protein Q4D38_03225 [Planctomycetia bacterium]|nr:hypothetical protein [Planctomycetia bacterium]
MKKSLAFSIGALLVAFLVGCGASNSEKNGSEKRSDAVALTSGGGVSSEVVKQTNDPRWRDKLLQTSLAELQRLMDSSSPGELYSVYDKVVERLDSWLREEARPDWTPPACMATHIKILDTLLPTLEATEEAMDAFLPSINDASRLMYRLMQEKGATSPDQVVNELGMAFRQSMSDNQKKALVSLANALDAGVKAIPDESLQELLLLREFMKHCAPEIKNWSERASIQLSELVFLNRLYVTFRRLDIIIGSQRMKFTPSQSTDLFGSLRFACLSDSYILLEHILLRNVSRWAQGVPDISPRTENLATASRNDVSGIPNNVTQYADELQRASAIFDWVAMNTTLCAEEGVDENLPTPRLPVEILLSGKATMQERAWLTILLARHQNLSFFLLLLPTTDLSTAESNANQPPSARLLLGFLSQGEIYLFDPELGAAVPASVRREAGVGVCVTPARWSDVRERPELLNQFWKSAGLTHEVSKEQIASTIALVETSPWHCKLRMVVLQNALSAENHVRLAYNPTHFIRQLEETKAFSSINYWTYPIQIVLYRALLSNVEAAEEEILRPFSQDTAGQGVFLWRGRILYLSGILTGKLSATGFYQSARLSDGDLEKMGRAENPLSPQRMETYRAYRTDASFAMGNISLMVRNARSAATYFETFVIPNPTDSSLLAAAQVACGRAREMEGDFDAAIQWYDAVSFGPMWAQARARRALIFATTPEQNPQTSE